MARRSSPSPTSPGLFDVDDTHRWLEPSFREQQGYTHIVGIDEAGRGPLAGPVVAAAVLLPADCVLEDLDDSKRLTDKKRRRLFYEIQSVALGVGAGVVSAADIDELNIHQATLKAMSKALTQLRRACSLPLDMVLVDGKHTFDTELAIQAVVKGDQKCQSIAAASVLAKVLRDQIMLAYHELYPDFQWDRNKGYPSAAHRQAVQEHGPTLVHRLTFNGVLPAEEPEPTEPAETTASLFPDHD